MKFYKLSPLFLLRTPLLAINTHIKELLKEKNSLEGLKKVYENIQLQEALFLSSPNLYEELLKWQKGSITSNEEIERLAISLWCYLLRMSSRCTPFGLFAGISMGEWGTNNLITLKEIQQYQRHTRPDMEYLGALAQALSENPMIRKKLLFFTNNSLYKHGEQLRFVDYHYQEKQRVHKIAAIDNSMYVEAVTQQAKNGCLVETLVETLCKYDIEYEEACVFIDEMIEARILVSELDGNTTGQEMLQRMITKFESIDSTIYTQLQGLSHQLSAIDKQPIGINPSHYKAIAESLKTFDVPYELNRLFQTDMKKPTIACVLDKKLAGSIRRGLNILNRLSIKPQETNLQKFAERFYERYEEREMPLLEVLDIESGIGYVQMQDTEGDINPIIDDLGIVQGYKSSNKIGWNKYETFLLQKLLQSHQGNLYEITLDFKDIEKFDEDWNDTPSSIFTLIKIVKQVDNELPTVLLEYAGGSATNLLGRFSCLNQEIHTWLSEIAETEQKNADRDNSIIAEIVHLPENRVGNILMRTHFRSYEIPYLAQSTVEEPFQIPLQDLYVSVKGDSVTLFSKKLSKRIIPALGNAHNYSFNSLPVYHFLCDLQRQNIRSSMSFSWGSLAQQFLFLPRVKYENLILHKATWHLKKADFEQLIKANADALMAAVQTWQEKYKIPNKILVVEGDNELLIDLSHEFSVETFIKEIKNKYRIQISEFLFDEDSALVKDENQGVYTNEIISVFLKDAPTEKLPDVAISKQKFTAIERSFPIGSEWLYFKIYCGATTADEILMHIGNLSTQLLENNWIDKWFFIRYADPKNHLRVRFHLKHQTYLGAVIQAMSDTLAQPIKEKLIWKLQTDTYEREVERYGSTTMALSEDLFCFDSERIIHFLSHLEDSNADERWLFSIYAIDNLLATFDYTLNQKTKLLEKMKTNFGKEFGMNKYLRKQLNEKYEQYKNKIYNILDEVDDPQIEFLKEIIKSNQETIRNIVSQIIQLCDSNYDAIDLLLESYIHMMLNRLFKSKQRIYEMLVYDFIYKAYKTKQYY